MAFKFNAILDFNSDRAIAGMTRASKGFDRMRSSSKKMGAQLRSVGQGIKSLGLATLPATAAFGFAAKTAADFEEQMSVVQSVILGTNEEMQSLTDSAKLMGATTVFTARQAGEGQEFLARAGLEVNQIVDALPGVLDAAAASGTGLGETAKIVADQLGAFGLHAKKAGDVADALSLTTALTNTNFLQLGEAMTFGGLAARTAGFSMAETASAMGVLANVGVRGTRAGTALKNALAKLAKPTKKAAELFGGPKGMSEALFRMVDGQKKLLPLEVIMANIQKVVAKSDNTLQTTAKAFELLGLRGSVAFGAFSGAIGKETKVTAKNLERLRKGIAITREGIEVNIGDSLPSLVALRLQIAGAAGTAKKMAAIRLDNLKGQFTLFQSAVSGVSIELGSLITGPLQRGVEAATVFVSSSALAFQQIISGTKISSKQIEEMDAKLAKFGISFKDIQEFASGFVEGFLEVRQAAFDTFKSISNFLKPIFGDVALTTEEFGKLAAKVLAIGAIIAPIILGIGAALFILGPIISGVVSAIGLIGSSLSFIWGIGVAVIGGINFLLGTMGSALTVGTIILKGLGIAFAVLTSPIGLIVAGIALMTAGIIGVARSWGDVRDAFNEQGFFEALKVGFLAFFGGIGDLFMIPINFVKDALLGLVSFAAGIAGNIVGGIGESLLGGIKNFLGLSDTEAIRAGEDTVLSQITGRGPSSSSIQPLFSDMVKPNSSSIVSTIGDEISGLASRIKSESLTNRILAQPPTAEENASASARTGGGSGSSAGGTQQLQVNVSLKSKAVIRGKDLLLISTEEQIAQSEMNGQQINPTVKQKVKQNGAPLAVGG